VLNTRLLMLADRWEEFWSQPDLAATLAEAFQAPISLEAAA
jgi:hypothetical protein